MADTKADYDAFTPSASDPLAAKSSVSGFLSLLPLSWLPYAQLMRLDRPAGFWAFYFPYVIGLAYAASASQRLLNPIELLSLGFQFVLWCLLLRGASCTWNDNIDQDFDRAVERCRHRPIARGAVTTAQGHVFCAVQTLLGVLFLALVFPWTCMLDAGVIAILFVIYPFGKRFTNYPQLILGFPFAGAISLACHGLRLDPWSTRMLLPTLSIIFSNVFWTMIYDTIYAHQDLKDDLKAGVKSMAVRFKDSTKHMTTVLAVIQILLLGVTGFLLHFGSLYYVIGCAGTATAVGSMIVFVDLSVPESCAWWFKNGFWFAGGTVFSGLMGQYVMRLLTVRVW